MCLRVLFCVSVCSCASPVCVRAPVCACMLLLLVSCVGLLCAFACVSIVCVCVQVIDCLQIFVIGLLSSLLGSVRIGVMMSSNSPVLLTLVLFEVPSNICFHCLILLSMFLLFLLVITSAVKSLSLLSG